MGRLATWSLIFGSFFAAGLTGYYFGRADLLAASSIATKETTILAAQPITEVIEPQPPLAVIVPHHNVVAALRAELLAEVAQTTQPQTIVLLAPNHFGSGSANVIVADKTWTRQNGKAIMLPNQELVETLVTEEVTTLDNAAFTGEHGVSNLLDDIGTYFPEATIVPIIFRDATSPAAVAALMVTLEAACAESAEDCGVIASVDMSHYLPAALADVHDVTTLRVLRERNQTDVWQLEVDSQPALAAVMRWADQQIIPNFVEFAHTNSGTLVGDHDIETTSHILGYYQAAAAVTDASATTIDVLATTTDLVSQSSNVTTFTFAGDVMLGREIGYQFQNNNFRDLFSNFGNRVFWGTDISWLNLEGPVSDQHIIQDRQPNDLTFLFSRESIAALQYLKITTAGLANNHTANQGRTGLETTRRLLDEASIDWVGDPYGSNETSIKRYDTGGNAISLIAVNVFDGDLAGLTELIQAEQTAGQFVIVLPHWGNEYQTTHSGRQEQLATEWVEAGANLIIGMHPHVVQDAQVITTTSGDQVLVLYSLGNFVFDQTFSQETQQGLIVAGSITAEQVHVVLQPIISRKLKPELARGETKQALIERVCNGLANLCSNGSITLPR